MKYERKSSLATREEILAAAKANKKASIERRVREFRMRALRGETKQTDWLTTSRDEVTDTLMLTMQLLDEKVRYSIDEVAKKLGEDPQELYDSLVNEAEPLISLDTLIEHLEDQDKFNEFLGKLSLQRVQEFKEKRLKELTWKWRSRLSAPAKHVLNDCLEGEYGKTFEQPEDELIHAARLSPEAFKKKERDEWLPKLRLMLETCEAETMERLCKRALTGDETKKEQSVDQDDMIDKFRAACEKRNLAKYKTIPSEVLHTISKEVGFKDLPTLKQFKNGNPAYHEARQYASLTQYAKKRKREEQS
jgi:hypothetical protein